MRIKLSTLPQPTTIMATFTGFDPYKLTGIRVKDRELGHGSYAAVIELEYLGLKCAGKKIHDVLLRQGDASYTVRRFEEELIYVKSDSTEELVDTSQPTVYMVTSSYFSLLVFMNMKNQPKQLNVIIQKYLDQLDDIHKMKH